MMVRARRSTDDDAGGGGAPPPPPPTPRPNARGGNRLARSVDAERGLRRREVLAAVALAALGYGTAQAVTVDPRARAIAVLAVVALTAVVTVFVIRLRTERARLIGDLRMLATHDALTGALNRGAFETFLAAELARARRHRRPLSVVLLDLDHFKRVNDRHGHAAGDHALRRAATIVADHTRAGDIFSRIGGEEFILLLPDTGLEHAELLAESLRAMVEETTRDDAAPLTVSVGVAGAEAGQATWEIVLAADRALYEAKRRGRNCVVTAPLLPVRPDLEP